MKNNSYKEEIIFLSQLPTNCYCFDCYQTNPEWASINNGIFLCISCAGQHRNLGLNISKIKSINLDVWNYEEYLIMKNSGNFRLKEFLEKFEINTNERIEIKYKYKIVQYYRDLIKAEIEQKNYPNEISKEEEKEMIKDNFKTEEQINKIQKYVDAHCKELGL